MVKSLVIRKPLVWITCASADGVNSYEPSYAGRSIKSLAMGFPVDGSMLAGTTATSTLAGVYIGLRVKPYPPPLIVQTE